MFKYLHKLQERVAIAASEADVPLTRNKLRAASVHESLHSNRVGVSNGAACYVGNSVRVRPELQRFGSIQAHATSATLAHKVILPYYCHTDIQTCCMLGLQSFP